jgi:hypothetical protein
MAKRLKFRDTILLSLLSRIKSIGVPEKNGFFTGALIGLVICIPIWGLIFYLVF